MIEFRDVTVSYHAHGRPSIPSVENLSLKVEAGDWTFLVGPSGAGKSTLLRLVYAAVRASQGQVVVYGRDITQISPKQIPLLRRKVGVVFQDFGLLSDKTAWENVAFALRVIGEPQAQILRLVPAALELVGMTDRAQSFPHELSGGQQQRIAIARALVGEAPILVADEPTGNLDPHSAREIGELFRLINQTRGTTILMATHDRALVDAMEKRVVRLDRGHIVSDENPGRYESGDGG